MRFALVSVLALGCTPAPSAPDAGPGFTVGAALADAPAPSTVPPLCSEYDPFSVLTTFPNSGLREASGLVVSRVNPGVLWMHNDSGGKPAVHAVSTDGQLLGKVWLEEVTAVDWEDLSSGPCPDALSAPWCLWIADTGDNRGVRDAVAVHAVPEPLVDSATPFGDVAASARVTQRLTYPGGPRDVEGIGLEPDGRVLLFSKGREGAAHVYELPQPLAPGETIEVLALGALDRALLGSEPDADLRITALSVHPAGGRLVVRTYVAVHQLDYPGPLETGDLVAPAWIRLPARVEPQGEALDWEASGGYVTVSEDSAVVSHAPCRTR